MPRRNTRAARLQNALFVAGLTRFRAALTLVVLALLGGVTATPATAQTPAQVGQWEGPLAWPVVAIHMMLLPNGQVLFWDGPPEDGGLSATIWNPATGAFTPTPNASTNVFCVGQAFLADGRAFIAGGHLTPGVGLVDGNLYDELTGTWALTSPMAFPRWYPTVTTLADGRMLVTSGSDSCETCLVSIPEIYDPVTNTWTQLTNASLVLPLYPLMFALPDGRVLAAGTARSAIPTRALNLATQTWSVVDARALDGHSAVMYQPGRVMKSGTAADVGVSSALAAATTYVLDMTAGSPAWRSTAQMAFRRAFHTLTSLPDGTVLVTGGGSRVDGIDTTSAVFAAELWSPVNETWSTMASMQTPRLYHSTALLLPDGRVLVSGGGRFGPEPQFSAEVYSPPYLFKGARPTVTSAPPAAAYNRTVFVGTPDAAQIASVSIIALGAVTHGFNAGQRYASLSFTSTTGGLNVQLPANANLAPPGYYMLFLVNTAGVPSVAKMVLIGDDTDGDGLPDAWERSHFGSLAQGANDDPDGDGLTNLQELAAGTNPNVADTDGDGFSDGAEVSAGSDPRNPNSTPIPRLQVSPSSLGASSVVNGPNPAGQTLTITNTSVGTINWTAAVNQPWLAVNPTSGTAPSSVTVTFSSAGLAIGNYSGAITVTAPGATNSPQTIPVTLTITPPGGSGSAALYAFEEGLGTFTADSSGNANHGAVTGATWTTQGKFGKALTFNGTTDFVSVPDAPTLDLGAAGTIEAWVKLGAVNRWNGILAKGNLNSDPAHNYALEVDDSNHVRCILGNGSQAIVLTSAATLAGNQFQHLACAWDGTTVSVYVNGAVNVSVGQSFTPSGNTAPLLIGQFGGNSDRLNGVIDEVRIYNRALTLTQIQQDMNTPIGGGSPPDTTPPSAPSNLTATAASTSQINLAWTSSTDNVGVTGYQVERCQGAACTNFVQIATPTGTSFNDTTGLLASTTYRYRVRAVDAVTNPSAYSNTAAATTLAPAPDTTPPTAPSNLTATAVGTSQINLGWTGSTDNVGVTGYQVERCQGAGCTNFVQIATPTGTTFTDTTGLQAATTYSYRVRAVDAATNPSAYSNTATATTPSSSPPPPGLVAGYAFNEGLGTFVADGSGNANHGSITGATWTTQGKFGSALVFNGTNNFVSIPDAATLDLGAAGTIEAWVKLSAINRWHGVLAKGNVNSDPAHNYALEIDDTNHVRCIIGNGSSARVLASAATIAVNQFVHLACTWDGTTVSLYVNGALNTTVGQSLTPAGNTAPLFIGQFGGNSDRLNGVVDEVRIYNRALILTQVQQDMNTAIGGGSPPDTTPPSAPSTLTATAASTSQINLGWTASTDNVGVTGYQVERCQGAGCANFVQIATPTGTSFNDTTGLLASTTYRYRVRAVDAATNPSAYSNIAVATTLTPPPPDTTPPSAPSNLTATAVSASQINLGWTGSTDNVGVTGYQIERCQGTGCTNFTQIATPTGTSFNNTTGLQASTTYSYRVRATDAATNPSPYSNTATATTLAVTTPPGLVAGYALNEGTGTFVGDDSGNANHGAVTGATWTTQGKFGSALTFNGTSNFVSVTDAATLDLGPAGTIEAWVKLAAVNRWNGVLAKGNVNSDPAHNYALEVDNTNHARCILGSGSVARVLASAATIVANQFVHLACTWNGTTLSLYVNGALNASVSQGVTPAGNTAPLYIGQFGGNSDRLNGVIDEVRIYNRALSATEIQQDMATPLP